MQPSISHHDIAHQEIDILVHDMRNHLSALKLNLYLLERRLTPELRQALDTMKDEVGEITHLVDDLDHLPLD